MGYFNGAAMRVEWSEIIAPYTQKAVEDIVAPSVPGLALLVVHHRNGDWEPIEAMASDDIRAQLLSRLQGGQGRLPEKGLRVYCHGAGTLPAGFTYCSIPDAAWRRGAEAFLTDLWGLGGANLGQAAIPIPVNLPG
jgi:hypothetical protein